MAQYRLHPWAEPRGWAAEPRAWNADPWGSFDQLRREMDTLFGRLASPVSGTGGWRGALPAVNLYETPEDYVLTAELPGIAPENVHVSVAGSTVTLEGERKIDYAPQEETAVHRRERQSGSFRRAFELPAAIDADKVEATHRNGLLMLRLPKAPEHRPRQISVQAG